MPVRRFRSVEAMEGNTWYDRDDPRLFQAIQTTWEFATRVTKPRFPPGVYKHRTVEEAEELREVWEQANFEAFHRRRQESSPSVNPHPARKETQRRRELRSGGR
jgi:hypothetical protein